MGQQPDFVAYNWWARAENTSCCSPNPPLPKIPNPCPSCSSQVGLVTLPSALCCHVIGKPLGKWFRAGSLCHTAPWSPRKTQFLIIMTCLRTKQPTVSLALELHLRAAPGDSPLLRLPSLSRVPAGLGMCLGR